MNTTIPRSFDTVRISAEKISCYQSCEKVERDILEDQKRINNLTRGKYNGYLSQKTRIKIKSYLHNWVGSYEQYFMDGRKFRRNFHHQFTFVTLTLPAGTFMDDKEIKERALKPFIQQLQRVHDVRNYFWRAEPHKNLRIHFHLLLDKAIHWRKVRDLWNSYMNQIGLIEDYRQNQLEFHKDGFKTRWNLIEKWPRNQQYLAYLKGSNCNWSDPNSTDIHKLKKVKNVKAYCVKYMTKEDENRPIGGRLWGCSDTLRDVKAITINLSYRLKQVLQQLGDEIGSEVFSTEFNWTLWRFELSDGREQYPIIDQIYRNFIAHCVRILYPQGVCTELELSEIRQETALKMALAVA